MTYFHNPHKKLYHSIALNELRTGVFFLHHQLQPFGLEKIPKAKNDPMVHK
jgi:hypothetical protein